MAYNILIIGGGGREHALAWKIKQSPLCDQLYIAPGNAGTELEGINLEIKVTDFEAIKEVINRCQIHMIIVGPEAPLVEGIDDFFKDHEVFVLGPSKAAAELEGSKSFANDFMAEFQIPTAGSKVFTKDTLDEGKSYIDHQNSTIVLKADGLAAGKGVLILEDKEEAKKELEQMLNGKFGAASSKVVIEDFLSGIEFSVFVITDGEEYQMLPIAKDYKRIGEGDTGLNTGGMGAISPVPFVSSEMLEKVKTKIIDPTINGLKARGLRYNGFIFFGLINVNSEPYVIEYNCRLGDPETEVILPRLDHDIVKIFEAVRDHKLSKLDIKFKSETAATVMLVSEGYPEAYEKGKSILIDQSLNESLIFHAGTKANEHDIVTNGGRVIAVTSYGKDHKTAVNQSLSSINKIHFDGMNFRKDIGFDV